MNFYLKHDRFKAVLKYLINVYIIHLCLPLNFGNYQCLGEVSFYYGLCLIAKEMKQGVTIISFILCPKQDLSLGPSKIAVFEDCQATALTTQPPRLDEIKRFVLFS